MRGRLQISALVGLIVLATLFGIGERANAQATATQQGACPGARVPIDTSLGSSPFVRMRLGNHEGMYLIDTGATYGSVDAHTFGFPAGSKRQVRPSSLPTVEGGTFHVMDLSHSAGPGAHLGTIGTDILSRRTIEFRYDVENPYMIISTQRCSASQFEAAGLIPVPQDGYYSSDSKRVRPGMQNTPVIHVRIGKATAPVWIDTGWRNANSSKQGSLMINEAFLQSLRSAGVAMHQAGSVETIDCLGKRGDGAQWQVENAALSFTTRQGQAVSSYGPPLLQVRPPSRCGTISEKTEPFGVTGALQLLRWGDIVFDGLNDRVWIGKSRAATSPEPPYRGIALAWNEAGKWSLTISPTLETAAKTVVTECNNKNGNCTLAASIKPTSFACIALARRPDSSKLNYVSNGSYEGAKETALANCASHLNAGATCKLEYELCND